MMDVVTLGETMALFTPKTNGYMRQATQFYIQVAGAESNVAIGLSRLGHNSGWISRLGDDEFGKKILNFIRGENVNTDNVIFDETNPTGLYFKEILTREEINVQYYREGSAASKMSPEDLSEHYISKAKYLHLTGITPALSDSCYKAVMYAIEIAKHHKVKIVFDPNIRKKLWKNDRIKQIILEISSKSDIVLPGIDEGKFIFGNNEPQKIAESFYDYGAPIVILKLGSAGAYCLSNQYNSLVSGFKVNNVIDPVGAGDGFTVGILSGLLDGATLEEAITRGNAIGAMVTMVNGDVEGLPEKKRLLSFISELKTQDVNR